MKSSDMGMGKPEQKTPEDRLWSMPLERQISVLKQIFSEEELQRFNFFEIQETAPQDQYETITQKELENPRIGKEAINYIKRHGMLKDRQDEIEKIIGMG